MQDNSRPVRNSNGLRSRAASAPSFSSAIVTPPDSASFPLITEAESAELWRKALARSWPDLAYKREYGERLLDAIEQCREAARVLGKPRAAGADDGSDGNDGKTKARAAAEAALLAAMKQLSWQCWLLVDVETKARHMLEDDGYEKWQAQLQQLRAAFARGEKARLDVIRAQSMAGM